jgi:hypothetical protein
MNSQFTVVLMLVAIRNEAECQFQNGSAQIIGTTKMISVTALEWTPEGLTTSIVTTQLVVDPHGVFKITWLTSVKSINAVSCSGDMNVVEWKAPFQAMMEPDSKLAPLTVRGNEVDPPGERATIVGVIVLIEGGGGGEGGVIGMLPLHPPLTSQMAAKAKVRRTNLTTSPPGTLK